MSASPGTVVVHKGPEVLAQAVAARLVTRLVDAQAARGHAHVVLTGGSIGVAVLAEVARSSARDAIDWHALEVWWGDERFLPAGDAERNETQARAALLDQVPLRPELVHPMPASDGVDGDDPERAAQRYADELTAATTQADHGAVPRFDVLLLGLGPDAHVASLFPGQASLYETERTVVGVRGAPKPPPTRISLTLPSIKAAQDVWFVVSGSDKASAVRLALSGTGELQVPGAGARGMNRTLWLLDREAASQVPRELVRPASP